MKDLKTLLIRILLLIAAAVGGGVGYDVLTDADAAPAPVEETASAEAEASVEMKTERAPKKTVEKGAAKAPRKRCVFAAFRDGEWVTGWGTVKKILPDDTVPPCHQRFLLVDPTGETLLIAHNIDRWPRLGDLRRGDIVEFKGEFKDTERGYLVHWTHPDPVGRKPGGYIRKGEE